MYLINKEQNSITKVPTKTFSELGFKEREHLQEWLAKNPEALGEELLIIQKEFSGFNDTNERLDLLALDKQGNLVVIENKLDDTGKDVTWQALKYASYCSSLSKNQVKEIYQSYLDKLGVDEKAEENLVEFFDNTDYEEISINKGQSQRIIMVAGKFRKEVTSTVLWLLNYKIRIQCLKVTPYALGEQLFLDIEQIIPTKDVEEFIISMADKNQEDISSQEELKSRHLIRMEFWSQLLKKSNQQTSLFQNVNPGKDNWISAGSGVSGVSFNYVITKTFGRAEIVAQRPNTAENKYIFDELFKQKDKIEEVFGDSLVWDKLEKKKSCRIRYELNGVNVFNKDDWDKMIEFMVDTMVRMEKAFKEPIKKISIKLKSKADTLDTEG